MSPAKLYQNHVMESSDKSLKNLVNYYTVDYILNIFLSVQPVLFRQQWHSQLQSKK
ncbi:hypothetical protein Plhal304r1_c034g0106531 [Plasmopara halstedii]